MRALLSLSVALLVALVTGCAGYQMGPSNGIPAGARSIQINPFPNKTQDPRLTEPVMTALRKELQRDGTYHLDTKDEGDILVTGTITELTREALSFQPNDILTARDLNLTLTVHVVARDRTNGKILVDRPITGRTHLRIISDQTSTEFQSIPMLAEDLARNITSALVDGSW